MSFRGLDPGQGLADYRNTIAEGWKQSQQLQQQDLTNRIAAQKAAEDTGLGMDPNSPFRPLIENVPSYGSMVGSNGSPISPTASVSPMTGASPMGQVPSDDLSSQIQSNIMELAKRYPSGVDLQTGYVHPFIYKTAETAALKKQAADAMAQRAAMDQPYKQQRLTNETQTNNRLSIGEQLKAEQAIYSGYNKALNNPIAAMNDPDLPKKIQDSVEKIHTLQTQLAQPAPKTAAPTGTKPGDTRVWNGATWKFKGGDPNDKASWEKI